MIRTRKQDRQEIPSYVSHVRSVQAHKHWPNCPASEPQTHTLTHRWQEEDAGRWRSTISVTQYSLLVLGRTAVDQGLNFACKQTRKVSKCSRQSQASGSCRSQEMRDEAARCPAAQRRVSMSRSGMISHHGADSRWHDGHGAPCKSPASAFWVSVWERGSRLGREREWVRRGGSVRNRMGKNSVHAGISMLMRAVVSLQLWERRLSIYTPLLITSSLAHTNTDTPTHSMYRPISSCALHSNNYHRGAFLLNKSTKLRYFLLVVTIWFHLFGFWNISTLFSSLHADVWEHVQQEAHFLLGSKIKPGLHAW